MLKSQTHCLFIHFQFLADHFHSPTKLRNNGQTHLSYIKIVGPIHHHMLLSDIMHLSSRCCLMYYFILTFVNFTILFLQVFHERNGIKLASLIINLYRFNILDSYWYKIFIINTISESSRLGRIIPTNSDIKPLAFENLKKHMIIFWYFLDLNIINHLKS